MIKHELAERVIEAARSLRIALAAYDAAPDDDGWQLSDTAPVIDDEIIDAVDNAVARVMIAGGFTSQMIARAAIVAHTAALDKVGFLIVPKEPTGEMKDAGANTLSVYDEPMGWRPSLDGQPSKAWRAMTAVAPKSGHCRPTDGRPSMAMHTEGSRKNGFQKSHGRAVRGGIAR